MIYISHLGSVPSVIIFAIISGIGSSLLRIGPGRRLLISRKGLRIMKGSRSVVKFSPCTT